MDIDFRDFRLAECIATPARHIYNVSLMLHQFMHKN
jgi:hypothetical protein